MRTYKNIQRIGPGQGDDYATGHLLDYPYFQNNFKMIAIVLSEQKTVDVDPKAIEQNNFTGNLQ